MYFYNVYDADLTYYEFIARQYYGFAGEFGDVSQGMADAHAIVATSWPTAYPVFNSKSAGIPFYFVQDFEPSFYSASSLSLLAENTYRMGLHGITAGSWLANKLKNQFSMATDAFDFGCDTSMYGLARNPQRSGIVFYARPEAARRGFELGTLALQIFAANHPEIEIHLYGAKVGKLSFTFSDHGNLNPAELNKLYNRCRAGLSLSLTNVSLVPHEMLACGCIPVVNDSDHNRVVLSNEYVKYVPAEPHALASALAAIVRDDNFERHSEAASASVQRIPWETAGAQVHEIFTRHLRSL